MPALIQSPSPKTSPKDLKIGLFMPCYIDLVYPKVGIATLELLERFGLNVDYPLNQTCCGQPMSNSGDQANSEAAERLFVDIFKGYDCIIGPAGSCVKQVRCHYDTLDQTDDVKHVREHTYELVEFLHDILKVESFPWAEFPHPVAIHNSCSSVRGLGLAKASEIMGAPFNKTEALLSKVKGLVPVPLDRPESAVALAVRFASQTRPCLPGWASTRFRTSSAMGPNTSFRRTCLV
jgi:L-lactate dehydrogenase complex protein LldE